MKTINDVFDPARNSLNALRLAFAAAVIVSHTSLVNGVGAPPVLGGTDAGLAAVAGFFAISGYLVTASRIRSRSLRSYLWRRFLRIYPAFLVALLVVAAVLAPLSTLIDPVSSVNWGSALRYVLGNAGLFVRQLGIENTLIDNAFPFVWNIPLWTLFYEALCYLLIGVLVSAVPRRLLAPVLGVLLLVATAASLVFRLAPGVVVPLPVLDNIASLSSFFLAGSLVFLHRERMPAGWPIALVAVAASVLFASVGVFKPLAAIPVAYLVVFLGGVLPFTRVGRTNDVSYGLYIYGFPVQQMLVLLFGTVLPLWLFSIVAIAATIPFAWASWLLVEKPALTRRDRGAIPRPDSARIRRNHGMT